MMLTARGGLFMSSGLIDFSRFVERLLLLLLLPFRTVR
jgi:hypothetical protein